MNSKLLDESLRKRKGNGTEEEGIKEARKKRGNRMRNREKWPCVTTNRSGETSAIKPGHNDHFLRDNTE